MRHLLLIALLIGVAPLAAARELIAFTAPGFLAGPTVSRSAFGATFVYRGQPPFEASELQLTVVAVPKALDGSPHELPAHCLTAFLSELRAQDPGMMVGSIIANAAAGPVTLLEQRWLSQRGPRMLTGVTACGLHRGYFVSANFADDLRSAVQSFPRLRAALEALEVHF